MNKKEMEAYGEFKGSTEATLKDILDELKGLRQDVGDLKSWRSWTIGAAAATGFIAGFLKDIFVGRST